MDEQSISSETLFVKSLQVLVKSVDGQEKRRRITVTIELQAPVGHYARKNVRLRLTDEVDHLFLFNLMVTEDDFAVLKNQQNLLVDFSVFPRMLVDLLEHCLAEEIKPSPKYLLVFSIIAMTGCGQLDVVEANPFKHLVHLALRMMPATDVELKRYLARCLHSYKTRSEMLDQKLQKTEGDLCAVQRDNDELTGSYRVEIEQLRSDFEAKIAQESNSCSKQLSQERDRLYKMQEELNTKHDMAKRELEHNFRQVITQNELRITILDSQNQELNDKRVQNESAISDLRSRVSRAEEELHNTRAEQAKLRSENAAMDSIVNQLRNKLSIVDNSLKAKEALVQRLERDLENSREEKAKLQSSFDETGARLAKREQGLRLMSDELTKGNEIIKKLQAEIRTKHSKLKIREQVASEQDRLLSDKDNHLESLKLQLSELGENYDKSCSENRTLRSKTTELTTKMEEQEKTLKTNQNVINWLNRQLNELQISNVHPVGRTPSMPSASPYPAAGEYSTRRIQSYSDTRNDFPPVYRNGNDAILRNDVMGYKRNDVTARNDVMAPNNDVMRKDVMVTKNDVMRNDVMPTKNDVMRNDVFFQKSDVMGNDVMSSKSDSQSKAALNKKNEVESRLGGTVRSDKNMYTVARESPKSADLSILSETPPAPRRPIESRMARKAEPIGAIGGGFSGPHKHPLVSAYFGN